jgi:hypothetical protein
VGVLEHSSQRTNKVFVLEAATMAGLENICTLAAATASVCEERRCFAVVPVLSHKVASPRRCHPARPGRRPRLNSEPRIELSETRAALCYTTNGVWVGKTAVPSSHSLSSRRFAGSAASTE